MPRFAHEPLDKEKIRKRFQEQVEAAIKSDEEKSNALVQGKVSQMLDSINNVKYDGLNRAISIRFLKRERKEALVAQDRLRELNCETALSEGCQCYDKCPKPCSVSLTAESFWLSTDPIE